MCSPQNVTVSEYWQNVPTRWQNLMLDRVNSNSHYRANQYYTTYFFSRILLFHLARLGNSTGVGFGLIGGNSLRVNPLDLIFSWLGRKGLLVKAFEVGVQECPLGWQPLAVEYKFQIQVKGICGLKCRHKTFAVSGIENCSPWIIDKHLF